MLNELSNRAFLWLLTILIALLVVGVFLWRIWDYLPTIGHYALIVLCVLAGFGVVALSYWIWHKLTLHHYVRADQEQQYLQAKQDREHARKLEADKLAIERERIVLEQMKATLEHQRLQAAAQTIILPPGHTAVFPADQYQRIEGLVVPQSLPAPRQPLKEQHVAYGGSTQIEAVSSSAPTVSLASGGADALQTKVEEEIEDEILMPEAPAFREMVDMITTERMPLCFVVDDDKQSPHYGLTVPQFGTIDDLLSLCVIGKPGRGKTVLLMYYSLILSVYGAETHIFDPHGVMAELMLLHGRVLPGMPPTSRIYYYDRRETMMEAVKVLKAEMHARDLLYRPHMENGKLVSKKVKHPLLILADELPILAQFDDELRTEYKERNKGRDFSDREEVPSLMDLVRRTVLEARKWRMFFVGSSQSIDATILPTKVTDALNSRIVFFNSDRKARMVGLDPEFIKKMLPLIRRAGPGMTIYDCARWDRPKIGAIPFTTVDDMLEFFGVDMESLTEQWIVESGGLEELQSRENASKLRLLRPDVETDGEVIDTRNAASEMVYDDQETAYIEENNSHHYAQENGVNRPVETPQVAQDGVIRYRLNNEQIRMFCSIYPVVNPNKDECLKLVGANTAYRAHANEIIQQYNLLAKKAK